MRKLIHWIVVFNTDFLNISAIIVLAMIFGFGWIFLHQLQESVKNVTETFKGLSDLEVNAGYKTSPWGVCSWDIIYWTWICHRYVFSGCA